jgi:hypothetical protein
MHVDGGDMAVSFVGLFVLAGLAALVFLAVLGLITLLTNPKTRDVAKILLGGLAAVVLLVILVGGMFLGISRPHVVAQREIARREAATARLQELGERMHAEHAGAHEAVEPSAAVEEKAPEPVSESADDAPPASAASGVESPPNPRERGVTDEAVDVDAIESSEDIEDVSVAEEAEPKTEPADEPVEEAAATPEEPEESNVGELSVAPLSQDNRPAWVDRKPYKEGSVYYWPVASDPRPDADQAELDALPAALSGAVADYINQKLRLGSLATRQVQLDPTYVRDQLVGEDIWIEPRNSPVGEFFRVHALVKFDREANTVIREAWSRERLEGRLWSAGGFLAVVLLFLSLIYSYLKIDQVTKGSRRALLRIAAILVILGLMLVAAGVASVGIA